VEYVGKERAYKEKDYCIRENTKMEKETEAIRFGKKNEEKR